MMPREPGSLGLWTVYCPGPTEYRPSSIRAPSGRAVHRERATTRERPFSPTFFDEWSTASRRLACETRRRKRW